MLPVATLESTRSRREPRHDKTQEANITHVFTECTKRRSQEIYITLCVKENRLATFMKRQYEVMKSLRRMWKQDGDTKQELQKAWGQL